MELNNVKENLISITLEAGEILKKYFYADSLIAFEKEGVDFTTEADREVDAFLVRKLKELYPQTEFLTEETSSGDYSAFLDKDNLWVIDPLDGTTNFSRKNPHFSISIALVNKGKPVLGIVYLPILNNLYFADKDGAFLNEKPISVSSVTNLREVIIACDWSWDLEKRKEMVQWLSNINSYVRQIKSMGSTVADLASLAEGEIDAYIHSGTKPWDVAVSALLIEKAGGKVTNSKGSEWNIFIPDIVATNGLLHEDIVKMANK
jgi:myo-inositol-1(or 4)-monophosphatase